MKAKIILSLFLFCSCYYLSQAQQATKDFVIGKITTLPSKILKEDRQLAIYTPENYATSQEKYPILYILDGEWHFHYLTGIVKQLVSSGDMPPTIVVGILNTNRNRDLTPSGRNDNPQRFGGAANFLSFITEEVQPHITENYRTQPFKILAGHSFGGLFTVYAMMEKPDFFQGYIALSPSLGRNNEQQVKKAQTFFEGNSTLPKTLYLAVGNEGGYTYLSTKKLATILGKKAGDQFSWTFEHLPNESHVSITIRGFLHGLEFIFKDINPEKQPELSDIFLIEKHFKNLSEQFGYEFRVPEYYYEKYTKEQIAERETDYALFILEKWKKNYPNSPQLIIAYADVHLLNGDFKEAKKYYKTLQKLDPNNEVLIRLLKQLK